MQRGQKGYEDSLREREMRSLPMKKKNSNQHFFSLKKKLGYMAYWQYMWHPK